MYIIWYIVNTVLYIRLLPKPVCHDFDQILWFVWIRSCQHSLKPLALPRQVNSGLFGCLFLPCFSAVIKTTLRSDDAISLWHEEPSVFIKWSFTPSVAIVVRHDRNRRRKRRWHLICRWIIKNRVIKVGPNTPFHSPVITGRFGLCNNSSFCSLAA